MASDAFMEQFALANEQQRSELLRKLVPNSPDYYHYHLIHLLNTEKQNTAEFEHLWKAYNDTKPDDQPDYLHILKNLKGPTAEAMKFLKDKFSEILKYDHCARKTEFSPSTFPNKLDESLIDKALQEKITTSDSNAKFTLAAYPLLLNYDNPQLQQSVLARMVRPNHEDLSELIGEDILANKREFGSFQIHKVLTLEQLDQVLARVPRLLGESLFVETYFSRILPKTFQDLDAHPEQRLELLKKSHNFSKQLSQTFNSHKTLVLYHILKFEKKQGRNNNDLFLEYLRIPKNIDFTPVAIRQKHERDGSIAQVDARSFNEILLPTVSSYDHQKLTEEYLSYFFSNPKEDDYKVYLEFVDDTRLREIYIESKLLSGSDRISHDATTPTQLQQLRDRIDIELLDTNKDKFAIEDEVVLQCAVKNVATLYIKIFEINTISYYETNQSEVQADIELDGLVPTEEIVKRYDEPSIRRVVRDFNFPSLKNRRGVFVIEFVGNGKSSRALIRKGHLGYYSEIGVSGHVYSVIDEKGNSVESAAIWADGHWFASNEYNKIILPHGLHSSNIVIVKDSFASLHNVSLLYENYVLRALIQLDAESLVRGTKALVVIKPTLTVAGTTPVSVEMVENVTLKIETNDSDEIATTKTIEDFELHDDRESTAEFIVPENLRSVVISVIGRVKNFNGTYSEVVASQNVNVNSQDGTNCIEFAHLRYSKDGYKICVLGKNGEPKRNRVLSVSLVHKFLYAPMKYNLQTDETGTIHLGRLCDITNINLDPPNQSYKLSDYNQFSYSRSITAAENELISVPYLGVNDTMKREEFSLFEVTSGHLTHDCFQALHLKNGSLQMKLPYGTYSLTIGDLEINLNVLPHLKSSREPLYFSHSNDVYEYNPLYVNPPFVSSISNSTEEVVLKIENSRKTTRVQVTTKYFVSSDGKVGFQTINAILQI